MSHFLTLFGIDVYIKLLRNLRKIIMIFYLHFNAHSSFKYSDCITTIVQINRRRLTSSSGNYIVEENSYRQGSDVYFQCEF